MFTLVPNRTDAEFFPVKVLTVIAGSPTRYTFREVYVNSSGVVTDLAAGRQNTSTSPAYAVDGSEFAVNDIALCRRGPGLGGTAGWELVAAGGACTGWGADWNTTIAYPSNSQQPAGSGNEFSFTHASTPDVYQLVPYTVIEIPDSVNDCVVHGNLAVSVNDVATTPSTDYYAFGSLANVFPLDNDCALLTDLPATSFISGSGGDSLVNGQRIKINASYYHTGRVGADGIWYGDRSAYFRVNCVLLRAVLAVYGVTGPIRLGWGFSSPTVTGFPATWGLQYVFLGRPATFLYYRPLCEAADPVAGCDGEGSGSSVTDCCEITDDLAVAFPAGTPGTGGATSATFAQQSADLWTWSSGGGGERVWTLACVAGVYSLTDYNGATSINTAEVDCGAFALEFDAADFGGSGTITAEEAP